jgi:single-strand DNA-binding protein
MTRDLNKVMIIGHLGRDPELRYTPTGRPVTQFVVATNRMWTTADGEKHTETEWFTVVAWGTLAEICKQHLTKGQQVYIEGRLQTHHWEDHDSAKRTSVEVVASEMIVLGERRETSQPISESQEPDFHTDEEYPF